MSNEQEPWLFDIRDFTIQLYADYNKPFTRIPIKQPVFHGFRLRPFFLAQSSSTRMSLGYSAHHLIFPRVHFHEYFNCNRQATKKSA